MLLTIGFVNASVTLSVHRYGPGYFPGTGKVESTGSGNGVGYSCNVPLKPGIGDERYLQLVRPVVDAARRALQPAAVVLQCGADALSRDPLGELNLTSAVIVRALWRFYTVVKCCFLSVHLQPQLSYNR